MAGGCGCGQKREVDPVARQRVAEERRAALVANRAIAAKTASDAKLLRQTRLEAAVRR